MILKDASLIAKLLGDDVMSIADVEAKHGRAKQDGIVTRIAPSPTGFMHIGGVYAALISERTAHTKDGTFFLRIEDTDTAREVKGARKLIMSSLNELGIHYDEGPLVDGTQRGECGPYIQSERMDIYKAYVKVLMEAGKAYPCFCTSEELDKIRNTQKGFSRRTGYYGEWALHRGLSDADIQEKLDAGIPYVIRLRAEGNYDEKITYKDLVKGRVSMPENDVDIVLLKASGLPTYHFAHAVDDHLMGTTHVIRGDEWVPSVPLHIQLFKVLGFEVPEFGHISPIQKFDDGSKRKLSKRSDPEASMTYYSEKGYPVDAVLEYLLNLANSSFADFRKENPKASLWDFPFEISGLNKSGALLDLVKLDSVSKDYISRLSAEEIFDNVLTWASVYDEVFAGRLKADKEAFIRVFEIERKGADRVRKDLSCWSMIWNDMKYFFDAHFEPATFETATELLGEGSAEHALAFLKDYRAQYNFNLPAEDWFPNMKELAGQHKYAPNPKTFKKNPDDYVGSVADAAKSLRVALTGRAMTPDLYSVMQVLGEDTVRTRIDGFIQTLEAHE